MNFHVKLAWPNLNCSHSFGESLTFICFWLARSLLPLWDWKCKCDWVWPLPWRGGSQGLLLNPKGGKHLWSSLLKCLSSFFFSYSSNTPPDCFKGTQMFPSYYAGKFNSFLFVFWTFISNVSVCQQNKGSDSLLRKRLRLPIEQRKFSMIFIPALLFIRFVWN